MMGEYMDPIERSFYEKGRRDGLERAALYHENRANGYEALANNHDCVIRGRHVAPRGHRNGNTKLTAVEASRIRNDARKGRTIASEYGISDSLVSMIRSGQRWTWI